MGLKEDLKALEEEAKKLIEEASDIGKLNDIRVNYLGKKGKIKSILKTLGKLSPEERKEIGQLANRIKDELEEALKEKPSY